MKVLVLGATGNLGSRLVPALLTHGHDVVAFIRSPQKLESILPAPVFQRLSIVKGEATDAGSIKRAILDTKCDAVVNTAGLAALAPWKKSDLPVIFKAVVEGVRDAGSERKTPLRAWFLGGTGVLCYPETETMLASYIPIYLEHCQNLQILRSLPPVSIDWSMLCPSTMIPESSDLSVPTKSSQHGKLVANATIPPDWQKSWFESIPVIGRLLSVLTNAPRYRTTLEQNAEFIANDLDDRDSRWNTMAVGIISQSA